MIEKIPGVCGGSACVSGTRIPVWIIQCMIIDKLSTRQILKAYPVLTAAEVAECREYVAKNQAEIAEELDLNVLGG